MSILGNVLGTTGIVGGQSIAGSSALNNAGQQIAYNQNLMAQVNSAPLVAKQAQEQPCSETSFVISRAHNGYVVTSRDHNRYEENRYIATTVEEVKDLVASILVQNKLSEP